MSEPIHNRMQDCGDGRHVGWWAQDGHWREKWLLIEVEDRVVSFSCCEGERAEKRIHFIANRERAVEIVQAMAQALGLTVNAPATPDVAP
jgi:hypothetical protein